MVSIKFKDNLKFLILMLVPLLAFLVSLTLGRYSISVGKVLTILMAKLSQAELSYSQVIETVIFQVRIPRIIVGMLVGGALSSAGAVYQGMFQNPMVSPAILGASSGAGFGAALGIMISLNTIGIQISAFLFGLAAVLLTYGISKQVGKSLDSTFVLILSGILVGTVFQSLISLLKYVADPYDKLPAITFWLMGSLSSVSNSDLLMILIPFLLGIVPLYLLRWKLNVLSFGDEEAMSLGINTKKLRLVVIVASTLMTSASVSICGMVGWVGLVVPHFARMLVGPEYKKLLPATLLMGSTYLLLVDNIARTAASVEIPLGILTSLIGAPFFIFLLYRTRRGWN
ncbi:MAG: FecCD family ABC transporter permease [Bacillota bacterium]